MLINVPSGKYVVAVSGGVDSVVLLDLLASSRFQIPNSEFIVAHFNHGIRDDSDKDENLVAKLAESHGLKFVSTKGQLGKNASEAEARQARYDFLHKIMTQEHASAIITAHHQDDVIETSIINILRGTNRRGLTALRSQKNIIRPLLLYPKSELVKYAKEHKLKWREDSTNLDKKFLRNKVRLDIVSKMTPEQRVQWLKILDSNEQKNQKIDGLLDMILKRGLHKGRPVLARQWFNMLPHSVSKEVIAYILHQQGLKDIDKKTIERLSVQIKTLPAGKTIQAVGFEVTLTKRSARFLVKDSLKAPKPL